MRSLTARHVLAGIARVCLPVQDIKQWLSWLRQDVGFAGLRLDFSKGYSAEVAREYIAASKPQLAIGEVWLDCSYTADKVLEHNQVRLVLICQVL